MTMGFHIFSVMALVLAAALTNLKAFPHANLTAENIDTPLKKGEEVFDFPLQQNLSILPGHFDSTFLPHMLSSHPINTFAAAIKQNLTDANFTESAPNTTAVVRKHALPWKDNEYITVFIYLVIMVTTVASLVGVFMLAGYFWMSLGFPDVCYFRLPRCTVPGESYRQVFEAENVVIERVNGSAV